MKYYFMNSTASGFDRFILIPKAKNRTDAGKIVEEDTAIKGYESSFWNKWGVILSIRDMKCIRKEIDKII